MSSVIESKIPFSSEIGSKYPIIKVPFPPEMSPEECINIGKDGRIPTKPPNCFILYRRAFQKALRASGHVFKINIVSVMASESWQRESPEVKKHYKDIAQQVHGLLAAMRAQEIATYRDTYIVNQTTTPGNLYCLY